MKSLFLETSPPFEVCKFFAGSLPPSPADSGVSDVDSSSSGHTSTDELKARLQPSIQSPVGNLFPRHPLSWSSPSHHTQRPPNHMSQQFYQPFATSKYTISLKGSFFRFDKQSLQLLSILNRTYSDNQVSFVWSKIFETILWYRYSKFSSDISVDD